MKPVAAGDDVARDLMLGTAMPIADPRLPGLEIVHADALGVEHDLPTGAQACGDQVLHHLVLAVDHHVLADEIGKIDAMVRAAEPHDHARVQHAFPPHALADTGIVQQLLRAVFQHAGADAVLDIRRGNAPPARSNSMPCRCSRCDSSSPAGPAPTIPTCVRIPRLLQRAL